MNLTATRLNAAVQRYCSGPHRQDKNHESLSCTSHRIRRRGISAVDLWAGGGFLPAVHKSMAEIPIFGLHYLCLRSCMALPQFITKLVHDRGSSILARPIHILGRVVA